MIKNIRFKMFMKALCILPLLIGLHTNLQAQHEVSGTVVDKSTGEPLPGVSILIQGTNQGAATNPDGDYTLDAPSGETTLVFSFVGYETQEIAIAGKSEVNVEMVSMAILGEELVVVGYGTQRREDVTGAVSTVNASDFAVSSPVDAGSLIKGKLAGVIISRTTGDPTRGTQLKLRGTTTLTQDANPLVLVDGVPGDLDDVPTESIESISVLRDGSAAAIYGSRASNGVILITTKKQVGVQAPTISYHGWISTQNIVGRPDMMSASDRRDIIQQQESGQLNTPVPLEDLGGSTNWVDQILRDNPISNSHALTFSSGSASTSYTATLKFENWQGTILESDNQELFGRFNIRHSMFENKLTADLNFNYRDQSFHAGGDGSSFNNQVWLQAVIRNPTDRTQNTDSESAKWQERSGFNYDNPLALIHEVKGENQERETRLNGTLTYDPVENVSLKILGAVTRWNDLRGYAETFDHQSTTVDNIGGFASRGVSSSEDVLTEFTATYQNSIEAHSFSLLGGYSWERFEAEGFFATNRDFPTDQFTYNNLGIGSGLQDGLANVSSGKDSWTLIGGFSRLNYEYDNRYILTASVRYEGNSRFGENNKWGWFPAVSAGWRISNEEFMQSVSFINELKIRGGFGVTGIPPGASLRSLASFGFGGFFLNNGEWIRGLQPSRNPNPLLSWERKEEMNLGFDFEVLNNRLSGSFDIYRRDTKDLLFDFSVPSPPFVFGTILANVGELRNEGIEIGLQYDVFQSEDVAWRTGFNYSTNRNELVSLNNDRFQSTANFIDSGGLGENVQLPTHRVVVGGKVGNFYGFKAIDVTDEGLWVIENAEGDPIPWDERDLEDRQVIGNGLPKHDLAWNNTFQYKNLDLNVFLRGAFDFEILNETRLFNENPRQSNLNYLDTAFDPVFGKRLLNNEWSWTDYYLEDGSYLKIDNITLGYSINTAALQSAGLSGISQLRFYVSGQNLHTFTSYSGIDPEVDIEGLDPGIDRRGQFPNSRIFTAGVNLRF